ncbi:mediator complex, subunit Med5, partial [Dipodascopsis tothii]|uniref:mediator complex, subunit Med5 n=1 Tax=Dipodascopsis tothii TaxID=44089 RepID=UPI0034CD55BF
MDRRPQVASRRFTHYVRLACEHEAAAVVIADLVTTAFDCLAMALMKQNKPKAALWKTFVVNKLPLVFRDLLPAIAPATYEFALRRPLLSVDDAVLALVNGDDGQNDIDMMFSSLQTTPADIRQSFLHSLAAVGLLDAGAVDRVLGGAGAVELPPPEEPFDVAAAVAALADDPEPEAALAAFVAALETASCATQALRADAVVQLVQTWAAQRDTFKLRFLCQALALNTAVLDALLLYHEPHEYLEPLARCLDGWNYDDEENFQDSYTDFGLVLLLVLSFVLHFSLDPADLGDLGPDSFCLRFVASSSAALTVESLEQDISDLLGGWIMALYDSNGISDELMRSCSPKDYFLLVPTLFQQSVHACARNVLDLDTLKGGLEYFLQPFLLPSLVGALHWITNHMWVQRDLAVPLQILQAFLLPPALSDEAQAVHRIVLNLCALPVYNCIQDVLKDQPAAVDAVNVGGMLELLTPHLAFR